MIVALGRQDFGTWLVRTLKEEDDMSTAPLLLQHIPVWLHCELARSLQSECSAMPCQLCAFSPACAGSPPCLVLAYG